MRAVLLAALLAVSSPAAADLGRGIIAFRAERFADALVEFQGAASPEGRFFEGASLYKLGRAEAALEAIEDAFERDPALAGEVGSLYRGLTLYQLKLYRRCRPPFERVVALHPDGRLATVASAHLAALGALRPDDGEAAGAYLDRGLAFAAAGRPRLALAFLAEARALAPQLRPDLVGVHLASAENALHHPENALAAVAGLGGAGAAVQRGRATLALGRRDEARQAFESAAASGDPTWSVAARVLLRTLADEPPR